jgi:hypothetical protein
MLMLMKTKPTGQLYAGRDKSGPAYISAAGMTGVP